MATYKITIFNNPNVSERDRPQDVFSTSTHQLRIPRHRICCVRSGRTGRYVVATSTARRLVTGGDL